MNEFAVVRAASTTSQQLKAAAMEIYRPKMKRYIVLFLLIQCLVLSANTDSPESVCTTFDEKLKRVAEADGFLAALDQSGGSTPKALSLYGVPDDEYVEGESSMFQKVHEMRTRIMTSKFFTGDRILGAILFENTMDRKVDGRPSATYLWEEKRVIPFLKIDKGLASDENGVQMMKPNPGLADLLRRAKEARIFGTKMRSVIKTDNAEGIKAVVDQQFAIGKQIIAAGLIPIIEPEVDINSLKKKECEDILKANILEHLNKLGENEKVILKLSLPTVENHYKECIEHPSCVRVVALSGGHPRAIANQLLSKQKGVIGSFSRALTEGLQYSMTDEEFETQLDEAIQSIYEASKS